MISTFTFGFLASNCRAYALSSGVRAGPAKYSIRRTVTGFAFVGLHAHVASAAELEPIDRTLMTSEAAATVAKPLRVARELITFLLLG
jgi:hypothetical protein